jgi:6-pyruvoyltetrahydropterin/6-carboxytetrahydropterin synthase
MEVLQEAIRYHDISAGHRVHGHESKCAHLHGHNYRIYFTCVAPLDQVGRVIDFGVIKSVLCEWLEENWDHKFLLWDQDDSPAGMLLRLGWNEAEQESISAAELGLVFVPFNPTAENMATYLLKLGNTLLQPYGVTLTKVTVQETRKCSATAAFQPHRRKGILEVFNDVRTKQARKTA